LPLSSHACASGVMISSTNFLMTRKSVSYQVAFLTITTSRCRTSVQVTGLVTRFAEHSPFCSAL
jgi:hypothetical protein